MPLGEHNVKLILSAAETRRSTSVGGTTQFVNRSVPRVQQSLALYSLPILSEPPDSRGESGAFLAIVHKIKTKSGLVIKTTPACSSAAVFKEWAEKHASSPLHHPEILLLQDIQEDGLRNDEYVAYYLDQCLTYFLEQQQQPQQNDKENHSKMPKLLETLLGSITGLSSEELLEKGSWIKHSARCEWNCRLCPSVSCSVALKDYKAGQITPNLPAFGFLPATKGFLPLLLHLVIHTEQLREGVKTFLDLGGFLFDKSQSGICRQRLDSIWASFDRLVPQQATFKARETPLHMAYKRSAGWIGSRLSRALKSSARAHPTGHIKMSVAPSVEQAAAAAANAEALSLVHDYITEEMDNDEVVVVTETKTEEDDLMLPGCVSFEAMLKAWLIEIGESVDEQETTTTDEQETATTDEQETGVDTLTVQLERCLASSGGRAAVCEAVLGSIVTAAVPSTDSSGVTGQWADKCCTDSLGQCLMDVEQNKDLDMLDIDEGDFE